MFAFYGMLFMVMGVIMLQAELARNGKFALTGVVAIVFTCITMFLLHSNWLFLLIIININLYLLVIVCYFTKERFFYRNN